MRLTARELLTRLIEILNDLDAELASLPPAELPSSRQTAALERWLQLTIQISIDLGDRLLAAKGVDEPPRSRDIFSALHSLHVIPISTARSMESLADLRNLLVHEYGEFRPATTPGHARQALPILREYAAAVGQALDSTGGSMT
ncbi:MAG TPA: HepT-like ribonuclease domain-containing protein [Armatimonadota bacterium]|nr:HepT-like ribonuclease domain-containing protein [Armatimonadota bacterium]